MTTMQYPTRRYYTDGHAAHADNIRMVTLPAIPGVTVDNDRGETDPKTRTIRRKVSKRTEASKYGMLRAALIEALKGEA